jgi:hypothetical protein
MEARARVLPFIDAQLRHRLTAPLTVPPGTMLTKFLITLDNTVNTIPVIKLENTFLLFVNTIIILCILHTL